MARPVPARHTDVSDPGELAPVRREEMGATHKEKEKSMDFQFEILQQIRNLLRSIIGDLSAAQLLHIPPGSKNHIFWNVGHILVTQQQLCYGLAEQPVCFPREIVEAFRKDSAPQQWKKPPEFEVIFSQIGPTATKLASDYRRGAFKTFRPYESIFGVTLNSIEDAIAFNNIHESVHLGIVMALRKQV